MREKRELMSIAPEALGQGKARSGGAASRKLRYEVLDRMAQLGTGLSPAQRNDWVWFREAWDAKMSDDHKENWGSTFCGWMQKILNAVHDGQANAFSQFVHDETTRNFKYMPMLVLPSESAAVAAVKKV